MDPYTQINESRVQSELRIIMRDQSLVGINFQQDENNIRHVKATVKGPDSTPYEGGIFKIDINLPDRYPFAPPHVTFITKIWHPNVSHQNGAVRLRTLNEDWTPTTGLRSILIDLQALLSEPDLSDPVDALAVTHYHASQLTFNDTARECTEKYAKGGDPPDHFTTRTPGRRITRIPKHLDNFLL